MIGGIRIAELIAEGDLTIRPYKESLVRENGVDMRIGGEVARLKTGASTFDPRRDEPEKYFTRKKSDVFVIQPDERLLVHTLEYLELPSDIAGSINLRSSFARIGLLIPPTVIDAGFKGQLTIAVTGSSFPVKLRARDPVFHVVFAELTAPGQPYEGRYTGQRGVTVPSFESERG